MEVFDDLARQSRDDGGDEDRLGHDHRARGVEQFHPAQRPGVRQKQIDDQADDDRGQAHQGIDADDKRLTATEPPDPERGPDRQADQAGQGDGGETDAQGQHDNLQQVLVGTADETERLDESGREILHDSSMGQDVSILGNMSRYHP